MVGSTLASSTVPIAGYVGSAQGQGRQAGPHKAVTGDDLRDLVNGKLFPYLHGSKANARGSNTCRIAQ